MLYIIKLIRAIFFDHWKSLPLIREFEQTVFASVTQEARLAIMDVLANGKDDIYPGSQEIRKRRVLSANEIKEEINKNLEYPVKKSNLYFHLQKLEELEFIQVVDYIPYGKREIAYYGRTARVFVTAKYEDKENPVLHNENIPILIKLIKTISPDVTGEQINDSLNKVSGIYKYDHNSLTEWMRENEDILGASDIDFRDLHQLMSIIQRYNTTTSQGLKEIANMLKFKQND